MRKFIALGTCAATLIAGGAAAQQANVQANDSAVTTDLDRNGNLEVVSWLYPAGGATPVCGFYFPGKPGGALEARMSKLLANLTFAVKGKRLRVSAAGFTRYESEDAAKAAGTGTCQPTKAPWDEAYREARVEFDVRSRTLPD